MSQPQYGSPQYGSPQSPQPSSDYPGKTLGLVGLILAIIAPLIGLIVSIIARSQSKNVGMPNGKAKAGIIVSIVLMVLGLVVAAVAIFTLVGTCSDLGPGIHRVNGVTYTCGV